MTILQQIVKDNSSGMSSYAEFEKVCDVLVEEMCEIIGYDTHIVNSAMQEAYAKIKQEQSQPIEQPIPEETPMVEATTMPLELPIEVPTEEITNNE